MSAEQGLFPRGKVAKESHERQPTRSNSKPERSLFSSAGADADDAPPKPGAKARKRRAPSAADPAPGPAAAPFSGVRRAEELSSRRLRPGLHVLARVRRVTAKQAVLSLPSGLTGYCRAADVNDAVAAATLSSGGLGGDESDEEDDDEGDERAGGRGASGAGHSHSQPQPRLARFLVPGQFVCATILRVVGGLQSSDDAGSAQAPASASTSTSGRKRVLVSLRPDAFNVGLSLASVRAGVGAVVCGFVRSIEDHGFLVATGIEGVASSFLPFSACDGTAGQAGTLLGRSASVGTLVMCTVTAVNKAARSLTLACGASAVSGSVSRDALHTIYTVKPGMLVEGVVERVLPNGLSVTFLQYFRATAVLAHLQLPATSYWASRLKTGAVVMGRVLFVDPVDKAVALSLTPHIVNLGQLPSPSLPLATQAFGIGGPDYNPSDVGTVIDEAVVARIDVGSGMLLAWGSPPPSDIDPVLADTKSKRGAQASSVAAPSALETRLANASQWGRTAYVHVSRIADGKVDSIEKLVKVGSVQRVRIVGFAGIEGVALGSTRPSVVNASVISVADVRCGDVVEGTVSSMLIDRPEDPRSVERAAALAHGRGAVALVKLGEGVVGAIPALHVADVLPARAFQSLKMRSRFFESVGLAEGSKLRCRVLAVNSTTGRIQLTLKKSLVQSQLAVIASFEDAERQLAAARADGRLLLAHGFVTAIRESGLLVTFFGGTYGLLPASNIVEANLVGTDHVVVVPGPGKDGREHATVPVDVLSGIYSLGQVVKVGVVYASAAKARIRLSVTALADAGPPSGVAMQTSPASKSLSVSAPLLLPAVGSFVDATVESVSSAERRILLRVAAAPSTAFSSFESATAIFADLGYSQLSDHPSLAASLAESGAVSPGTLLRGLLVLCHLRVKVDGAPAQAPHISVTAKPLLLQAATRSLDLLPASVEQARPGQLAAGYVASITEVGAFVRFLDGCTGLAPRVRWTASSSKLVVGQSVLAVVDRVASGHSSLDGAESGTAGGRGRITLSLAPDAVSRALGASHFASRELTSTFTFTPSQAPPHSAKIADAAIFLRGFLLDQEVALSASPMRRFDEDEDEDVVIASRFVYRPGAITHARVTAVTGDKAILELAAPSYELLRQDAREKGPFPGVLGFAALPASAPVQGSIVAIRILDVDTDKNFVLVEVVDAAGAGAGAQTMKRKRAGEALAIGDLAKSMPAELNAPVVAGLAAPEFAVGEVLTATVVTGRTSASIIPYVVVLINSGLSSFVAFASIDDFVDGDDTGSIAAGSSISVVITQVPSVPKFSKKGTKSPAGLPMCAGDCALAAVNSLVLCSAVRALVAARRLPTAVVAKKRQESADGEQREPQLSVAKIVPGMILSARVIASVSAADKDADEPGDNAKDRKDPDSDEEEEGAATRPRLSLEPLRLRLRGVRGSYVARLSLAECVDFDPVTGDVLRTGTSECEGAELFRKLAANSKSSSGSSGEFGLLVKVVSVTVRQSGEGADLSAATKRARSDSVASASAALRVSYSIDVTVRRSDIALPPMHLASARPTWPSDVPVVSAQTVLSGAKRSGINPSSFAMASLIPTALGSGKTDAAVAASAAHHKAVPDPGTAFCAGATGFGVVEGLSAQGTHLLVGLGGGLRGRVPLLEAGDDDAVRAPDSGDLCVTPAAAAALSSRCILRTHAIGSIVPVVVVHTHHSERRADLSIRRARAAVMRARAAVESEADKAALLAPHVTATSKVAEWLLAKSEAEAAASTRVGTVTLCRVIFSDTSFAASLPSDTHAELEFAPVPPASSQLRVLLPGGTLGTVDVTHVADRSAWRHAQCGRFRDGDVAIGVVVEASVRADAALALQASPPAIVCVSLRESWVAIARAATETSPPLKGKKGRKDSSSSSHSAALLAAAAERLRGLEDEEVAAVSAAGVTVSGIVANTSTKGCFVRLCRSVTARVPISQLSDRFVPDPTTSFPPGRLVTGKVTAATGDVDGKLRVDLSLKRSVIEGIAPADLKARSAAARKAAAAAACLGFSELEPGDVFDATVTKVAAFGFFVALDGTDRFKDDNAAAGKVQRSGAKVTPISGLVHVSEMYDEEGDMIGAVEADGAGDGDDDGSAAPQSRDAVSVKRGKRGSGKSAKRQAGKRVAVADHMTVGDRVRVIVVEADVSSKKISLSVKPSRLDAAAAEAQGGGSGEAVGEGNEDVEEEGEDEDDEEEEMEKDEDEEGGDDSDGDENGMGSDMDGGNEMPVEDNDDGAGAQGVFAVLEELDKTGGLVAAKKLKPASTSSSLLPLRVAEAAFDDDRLDYSSSEGEGGAPQLGAVVQLRRSAGAADGEVVEGEDGVPSAARGMSKRAQRVAEEAETRRLESRLASGEAERNPETKEDYERLVLAQPGSSMAWIRFMAWQLSLSEVDSARRVAERALAAIPYRQERDKLNVWTALLNLEALHGTQASLARTFQRALAAADPRDVHSAMIGILTRLGAPRAAEAEALFAAATKRFGADGVALWQLWASFRLRRGDASSARALLAAATAALPKSLHVDAVVQFALLEYKFAPGAADADTGSGAGAGSPERGRTLLEGVLAASPKRLDVWSVYLDAEVRAAAQRAAAAFAAAQPAAGKKPTRSTVASGRLADDDLRFVRALFERAIAQRQSSKKMKFVLKRYAAFETEHGDSKGVERVREAARAYVAAATNVAGGKDAEDD